MSASARPQKIKFADMRDQGVRGLLIYCCSHSIAISGDRPRLSDIGPRGSSAGLAATVALPCGRISLGTGRRSI